MKLEWVKHDSAGTMEPFETLQFVNEQEQRYTVGMIYHVLGDRYQLYTRDFLGLDIRHPATIDIDGLRDLAEETFFYCLDQGTIEAFLNIKPELAESKEVTTENMVFDSWAQVWSTLKDFHPGRGPVTYRISENNHIQLFWKGAPA